jgi:hypothetical protein
MLQPLSFLYSKVLPLGILWSRFISVKILEGYSKVASVSDDEHCGCFPASANAMQAAGA